MLIRKFQPADLDQVMQIWLNGNRQAHSFIDSSYWDEHYLAVQEALQQAEVIVAENNSKIVGFAGMQDDYLAGIFVQAGFQHQGIGSQLLRVIKQSHSSINLDVYLANEQAVHFYQGQGFKVIKEQADETGQREYLMNWRKAQP